MTDVVIFDDTLEEVNVKLARHFFIFDFFILKNAEHFVIFERTVEQWKVLPEHYFLKINKMPC